MNRRDRQTSILEEVKTHNNQDARETRVLNGRKTLLGDCQMRKKQT